MDFRNNILRRSRLFRKNCKSKIRLARYLSMDNILTVFDSEGARSKLRSDYDRFKRSMDALAKNGIELKYVDCRTAADVAGDGEAQDIVESEGFDSLPIAEYNGVVIAMGEYISDQDLADFLNVPDGVLSVDRSKPPALNELGPSCSCGSGGTVPK